MLLFIQQTYSPIFCDFDAERRVNYQRKRIIHQGKMTYIFHVYFIAKQRASKFNTILTKVRLILDNDHTNSDASTQQRKSHNQYGKG